MKNVVGSNYGKERRALRIAIFLVILGSAITAFIAAVNLFTRVMGGPLWSVFLLLLAASAMWGLRAVMRSLKT
jgi:hypothetical protein